MDETTAEIGGNSITLWLGNKLTKWGNRLIKVGKRTTISNPKCMLLNPFTLVLHFRIDSNTKYQLVLQGDYKDKYKEFGIDEPPINGDEMLMLIVSNQHLWFLKE